MNAKKCYALKALLRVFGLRLNNRGMSNAISTLMTLTAAVALTGATVLVATNISTNQMSNEKLSAPSAHVWYVNTTSSVGGIILTNSGQTDALIRKISINGANCVWNNQDDSFILFNKIEGSFPGDLQFTAISPENQMISIGNKPLQFEVASEEISLKAGSSIAFYIATPNNILVYNVGQPVTIVITTTQAIYSTQTNVESST